MARVLIVPAAGLGTRLGSPLPKLLVSVAGVAMIDRLLALYRQYVSRAILVVNPAALATVRRHIGETSDIDIVVQSRPTGMLDAILLAAAAAADAGSSSVWITWCDQVAVDPRTVRRLARTAEENPSAAIVMPTVHRSDPYIHLERDGDRRIVRVLHRREGDSMPEEGESDMGLFALSSDAFDTMLPAYAGAVESGRATGERNFLPFIAWAARRAPVITFPAEHAMEAVGVNTPAELRQVEAHLRAKEG
jgi:bifunctional UDP-N-acetylglucosamine pyrophosphorylase / glucosamine-1-phosphate N-acetyltransferase